MNNMIIKNISIISRESKKAKYAEFKSGINIVTSRKDKGGNYVGKSSLLRSIYHTLGADGKFTPNFWEKEGKYIYILEFVINKDTYVIMRYDGMFKVYKDNNLIKKVINRDELSQLLTSLFNQKIYLKNKSSKYTLAHPAFNYLLNYIDQKEIRVSDFTTFNNLSVYSNYYSDLLYSHMGVNNQELNRLKLKIDSIDIEIQEIKESNQLFESMLSEFSKNPDLNNSYSNIETLKNELKLHQEKYETLIIDSNKIKQMLVESGNLKIELELIINEMRKNIDKDVKTLNKSFKAHTCPVCSSEIEDNIKVQINNLVNIDSETFHLIDVERELEKLNRKIKLTEQKYEDNIKKLKEIEVRVFEGSTDIDKTLKSYGIQQVKNNIYKELTENNNLSKVLMNDKKDLNKKIRRLNKSKKEVNGYYISKLYDVFMKYNLGGFNISEIKHLDTKIKVDGTRVNITQVAWLLSLLETKYKFNPGATIYPLIFDNPNNADFDEANEQKIFRMIFDHIPKHGQVITSLVGFDKNDYSEYKIENIITLTNPENSLLNQEDFTKCMNILNKLM